MSESAEGKMGVLGFFKPVLDRIFGKTLNKIIVPLLLVVGSVSALIALDKITFPAYRSISIAVAAVCATVVLLIVAWAWTAPVNDAGDTQTTGHIPRRRSIGLLIGIGLATAVVVVASLRSPKIIAALIPLSEPPRATVHVILPLAGAPSVQQDAILQLAGALAALDSIPNAKLVMHSTMSGNSAGDASPESVLRRILSDSTPKYIVATMSTFCTMAQTILSREKETGLWREDEVLLCTVASSPSIKPDGTRLLRFFPRSREESRAVVKFLAVDKVVKEATAQAAAPKDGRTRRAPPLPAAPSGHLLAVGVDDEYGRQGILEFAEVASVHGIAVTPLQEHYRLTDEQNITFWKTFDEQVPTSSGIYVVAYGRALRDILQRLTGLKYKGTVFSSGTLGVPTWSLQSKSDIAHLTRVFTVVPEESKRVWVKGRPFFNWLEKVLVNPKMFDQQGLSWETIPFGGPPGKPELSPDTIAVFGASGKVTPNYISAFTYDAVRAAISASQRYTSASASQLLTALTDLATDRDAHAIPSFSISNGGDSVVDVDVGCIQKEDLDILTDRDARFGTCSGLIASPAAAPSLPVPRKTL